MSTEIQNCVYLRRIVNLSFLFTSLLGHIINFAPVCKNSMQQIIQQIVHCDMLKDDNSIFKNNQDIWGDIVPLMAFDICKTEPPSCFSCKIYILWIVSFLQNRGDFIRGFITMRLHALRMTRYVLLATEVTIHMIKCPVFLDSSITDCECTLLCQVILFPLSKFLSLLHVIIHG
jgi:hypothetical protein